MHDGKVVATHIVLSHEEQLERLRVACPEAAERAVVSGDPCLDRLQASTPLRETYRQAFGLDKAQRFVVVSSTWGTSSLLGANTSLVLELAQELPHDSYRIAVALHPNIVQGHSPWQVKMWLDECTRAGVLVLENEDLWRPALVAADLTIGDHGSVTFYSACLGTPVVLGSAPEETVHPDSPIALLLRTAPRLEPVSPTRLDDIIDAHRPGSYAEITELATSVPGKAADLLRDLWYSAIELAPPTFAPSLKALPVPDIAPATPRAWTAEVSFATDGTAALSRFPVDGRSKRTLARADTHLVVGTDEPDIALLRLAEVVMRPDIAHDPDTWTAATLRALPGCRVAAIRAGEDEWRVETHDGLRFGIGTADPAFVSVLYALLGGEAVPQEIRLRRGSMTYSAKVTVRASH
ncbi:hypothetical protein BS329_26120 [Amycolatopsis coloradensis]|uniref:Translation initiation factor 2 n=1 Tax=Amycolatopsis coloradensis TaxID=76021 RepID=A0A1R0KL77_9PSEU|nr:hypothetical protein [Amycolatopsis coloradensis]OLZ47401.1 hypothetical protein BS329_26120 [Amycolatopsis coloradensis]